MLVEHVVIDPDASDWSELDLLTVREAEERLRAEITATEQELAAARADGTPVSEHLSRRLTLLRERLNP
jgi:hypothetical protein